MSMNIFENPFYILGASPRDNRRRISVLAEEKAFLSNPEAVNEARNALLIPQKRLAAEMRWFPGVEDAKVRKILAALQALQGGQVPERMEFSGLNSIALLNFGVYTFCFRHFGDVAGISQSILTIDEVFEDLDIETLGEEINDDREAAGFPEAEGAEIEDEFLNYRDDVIKSLSSKLTTLPLENYMELSEDLAKNLTENSVILGGMLDEYELYIAPHMEEEKQRILGADSDIDTDLETLCLLIREWGRLALPLHLATTPRRLKRERLYQDEEEIFHAVRSLALELHNKYGRTEDALQLTSALSESLTSLSDESKFRLREDIVTLEAAMQENSVILGGMLDEYELHIAPHMEEAKQKILRAASDIDTDLETLCSLIREWGRWALPLHLATTPRGLKRERLYQDEEEILYAVRSLALELHNKYDRTEDALQLTRALSESLTGLSDESKFRLREDIVTLEAIIQGKQKRRKIRIGIIAAIFVIVLLISNLPTDLSSSTQKEASSEVLSVSIQTRGQRRAALDAKMKPLGTQIEEMRKELRGMEKQIEAIEGEIKFYRDLYEMGYDENYRRTYNREVDQYNALAEKYNALLKRTKDAIETYNNLVDEYNRLR